MERILSGGDGGKDWEAVDGEIDPEEVDENGTKSEVSSPARRDQAGREIGDELSSRVCSS